MFSEQQDDIGEGTVPTSLTLRTLIFRIQVNIKEKTDASKSSSDLHRITANMLTPSTHTVHTYHYNGVLKSQQ